MASVATGRGDDFIGCVELQDTHCTYRLRFCGILPRAEAEQRCTPDGDDLLSRLVQAARGHALGTVQGSTSLVQVPAASSVGAEESWEATVAATLTMCDALRASGHALGLGARGLRIYEGEDAESRLVLDRSDTCFAVLGPRAPDQGAVLRPPRTCMRCGEVRPPVQSGQFAHGLYIQCPCEERQAAAARSTAMAGARASGGPISGAQRRVGRFADIDARLQCVLR